jgi:hypothetical protein
MNVKKSIYSFFIKFRALFCLSIFFPFVLTLSTFSDKSEIRFLGIILFVLLLLFLCGKFFHLIDEIDTVIATAKQPEKNNITTEENKAEKIKKYPL